MNRLNRYVSYQLFLGLVLTATALTSAVWLTQSLRFIDSIVNRGLPLAIFLKLTLLLLPTFVLFILPISLFASVAFVYSKLTNDRELIVMRAAGFSQFALVRPALIIAGLVTLSCYFLSLYAMPASYRAFKDMQFEIRNEVSKVLLKEGVFDNLRSGITVFVRSRESRGELRGILVHDARNPKDPVTLMAERGILIATDQRPQVIMINGNRQAVGKNGQISLLYFDRYVIELDDRNPITEVRWREPRERFIPELLAADMSNRDNVAYINQLLAEGHRRLVTPLYAIAYALIGAGIILSAPFSRRGLTVRIIIAVLLVATIEASGAAIANLAHKIPVLLPALYLTALLPILFGLWLLRHPTPRRRLPQTPETPQTPESAI